MKEKDLEDIYELSPMQQGILYETLSAPESRLYLEQWVYTLSGQLDVSAFKQAWQSEVNRHPILRTGFFWEEIEKPVQVVYRSVQLPHQHQDWKEFTPAEQQARLENFLQEDRELGFNLSEPPPMRIALYQIAEDTYEFIWSFHHLVLDRWSVAVVLEEVYSLYHALCRGEPQPLAETPPFGRYIAYLQDRDSSQNEAYWRPYLAGFSAPTPLGPDRNSGSLNWRGVVHEQRQTFLSRGCPKSERIWDSL